jgi:alpha-beta hydrolase superfamily lysophospholipase
VKTAPNEGALTMATYVLIHGAGDVAWYWHLLEAELRSRGHEVVAPDLPCEDDSAGLADNVFSAMPIAKAVFESRARP